MTTIKQILDWPVGYKSGGFFLTVKTVKKGWEVPQPDGTLVGHKGEGRIIVKQAILTDLTGDLIADVKTASPDGNHNPLRVGQIVRVIVCEVQLAYPNRGNDPAQGKKLYIDQYEDYIKQELGEPVWGSQSDDILGGYERNKREILGKCRTLAGCAYIEGFAENTGDVPKLGDKEKVIINKWAEYFWTGE